jgi:FAD/FMN-containing dehydrogenase
VACPGSGSTGTQTANWRFENWARTQRVSVPTVYRPTSVQEIVAAVLEVEGRQENVKAIGSEWAYGAVAVDESTKNVIATRGLRKKLTGIDPTKGIIPFALRDELKPTAARYLHVEAGIGIWRLNCMLDEQLVAMPTLGASNGQTIAGAIATSTHGTDVDAAPIADELHAGDHEPPANRHQGFRIGFKPTAPGNRHASLRVHSDAAGSPFELTLAGVGLTPP